MASASKAVKAARSRAKPEPLDWRELASGPALRGLNDVLGGAPPPAAEPATATVAEPFAWVDGQGLSHEARRVHEVLAAEHSMTMGEERFYHSVWNAAADVAVESPDSRTFALGYDRLARLVRLDEKSVRLLLPKLAFKRIVERIAGENSAARIGRTYRIFSPAEILRRQRAAGLRHIVKKGRAVEFVWRAGQAAPVAPAVGVPSTPAETWSAAVDGALREFGADPGAAMVRALVAGCRGASPDVSAEEIVYFIHERGRVLRKRPVSNPMAYLLVSVPACCEPERLRQHREEARAGGAEDAARRAETDLYAMRGEWQAWLKDPAVGEEDREFARRMLAGGKGQPSP